MRTVLILLFTITAVVARAQDPMRTEGKGENNLYHQTLIRYCDYLETQVNKSYSIYIEENSQLTKDLPGQIKAYRFQYLTGIALKNLLIEKESAVLWRMLPLKVEGDKFIVRFHAFKASYHQGDFSYADGPKFEAVYTYNPAKKSLVFESSNWKKK